MKQDRRQYPRLPLAVDVAIEASGHEWHATTVDLSPYGTKVASTSKSAPLAPGTTVQLRFALPDGDPPLSIAARVSETSPAGIGLSFVDLKEQETKRLKDLVDSLLLQEWQGLLSQFSAGRPFHSQAGASPQPPEPAEVHESARKADAPAEVDRPRAEERPVAVSDGGAEREKLQALLNQAGLGSLCLPSNGVLSPQWRAFLERLAPTNGKSAKTTGKTMVTR